MSLPQQMELAATIGRLVETIRKTQRYSQRQFAELAGISSVTLGSIERGQGNPTLSALVGIANASGMALDITFTSA